MPGSGRAELTEPFRGENPRLGVTFGLEWDPTLFPWIVAWMPYGGALDAPLAGSYALGVEPWTTMLTLEDAVRAGEALELQPGEEISTIFRASIR